MDREAEDALVSYLRIDTTNPPGNETAGAQFLQQLFAKDGIDAQLIGSNPARQSIYARLSSGTSEKALLLLHHIDVVPVAMNEWSKPPFSGLRSNGYIWGRGALDIKSLGIAEAMAMIDLKRRHAALKRDIIYLGVADEELGGLHGCKELLEKHPELFSNVGFVLNEAGYNETIVDKITFWGIEVQQKVPLFPAHRSERTGRAFGVAAGRWRHDDGDDPHARCDREDSDAVSCHAGGRALLQFAGRDAAGCARRGAALADSHDRSKTHRGSVTAGISLAAA
jgi:acetylornithine deacetylase/succinyl-diaminopimelate desuccinylase-like protein